MASPLLHGLLRKSGFEIRSLGPAGWHVTRTRGPRTSVRRLGRHGWLVESGPRRRKVRRIGPPELGTHLVYSPRAARGDMHRFQKKLGELLAEEQIGWVLRELGINCVLDVGANKGQYATRLRETGYTGRIVSFEPLPHLVAPLRKAAEADPDWLVHECALGDENTTTEINVVPGKMSSLLPSSDFGRSWSSKLREQHTETIELRRLDSLLDEAVAGLDEPRVYLKMDTQGYDLQTFRGAGDRIHDILGMQSEVSCVPIYDGMPRLPEQLTEYESAGFEIAGMFPVSRHVKTLRVIEFDCVMVRAAAFGGGADAS